MKKRFLVVVLLIIMCVVGCNNQETEPNSTENADVKKESIFGLSRVEFNCEWKELDEEQTIAIADDIINGKMWVNELFEPLEYENLEGFDWNVQYTTTPNTFQLYLQCLNPIVYLTSAYEISSDEKYLDYAMEIIRTWAIYEESDLSEGNSFVWYDHGTALRAEGLIYYAIVSSENGFLDEEDAEFLYNLVEEHAIFLSIEANYTENHNHGIFQDRALIYCSYFLDNEDSVEYLNIAKERLLTQKEFAFTSEMVHVENSPGYQVGVMDVFRIISEFLIQFDDEFGNELYGEVVQSAEFMAYMMKPNGFVAEIGDTSSSLMVSSVQNEDLVVFGNDHLSYAATQGEQGVMPEKESVFFVDSGYYAFHDDWSRKDYNLSTWSMFKSGYHSQTHKHADDNSFMLYSKGYDIFVDTGWYSYMNGETYRDYFVSALGHNTVVVDERSYSPTVENSSKVGIYEYKDEEAYDYILAYNNMYEGVLWDRHFYNLGDAILLYDNLVSDEEHTYTQLLHASEYMELVSQSEHETLFKLNNTGYYVRVSQLIQCGSNTVIKGDFDKEKLGYISREAGHIDSIQTLRYDVTGKSVNLVTLITIEDQDGNVQNISDMHFDLNEKTFNFVSDKKENVELNLVPRERIISDAVITEQSNDNTFTFTNLNVDNSEEIKDSYSYAWYIIDKLSAKVIYKSDWSDSNVFEYKFEDKGDYLVKAYTRSSNMRLRTSAIVSVIEWDEETEMFREVSDLYPYMNLQLNGNYIEKISDAEYKFGIDYNYSWNSFIKWYIYRNGGYYTVFSTQNEHEVTYEFTEPGKYTVMYYLTTPDGDKEYWNFEQVVIE